jgi:dihydroorotase
MTRLLVKGGTLVTSRGMEPADVLIQGGTIEQVAAGISDGSAELLDARGLHLLPGVLDSHVHFREPGMTHKEDLLSGSRACAAGGVTSFFDMPNTRPAATTRALIAEKKALAAGKSLVNYNFFIGAARGNLDELNVADNLPGIKVFLGSSTGGLLVDDIAMLEDIFSRGNRLIAVHAEDEGVMQEAASRVRSPTVADHGRIRTTEAALTAVRRIVKLSGRFHRRLHVLHVSSADEVAFLAEQRSPLVSAEVTPHHLLLFGPEAYERLGTLAQVNPPIRERHHTQALWKALEDGVIQCIGTDHAPHTLAEKAKPYPESPSGVPGVETALPLMLDQSSKGRCSVSQVVEWMSENPARLFGAMGKGRIEPGLDADLVLVDLKKTKRVGEGGYQTKCGWSPYDGMRLTGWPVATIVGGRVAWREGTFDLSVHGTEIKIN